MSSAVLVAGLDSITIGGQQGAHPQRSTGEHLTGWIRGVSGNDSQSPLPEISDALEAQRSKFGPHPQRTQPRSPGTGSTISTCACTGRSRPTREAIAVTVSAVNGCAYCVAHHLAVLRGTDQRSTT